MAVRALPLDTNEQDDRQHPQVHHHAGLCRDTPRHAQIQRRRARCRHDTKAI
jgi:hypothetical protein